MKYAVTILFQKHTNYSGKSKIENKVRLFFVDANSVDEAVGIIMNNDVVDHFDGFSVSAWQAAEVPKDEPVNEPAE